MSKSPAAPLTLPAIPKKGEAAPAVASIAAAEATTTSVSPPPSDTTTSRLPSRVQATIAVTVRLDERRYERMKTWGMTRRATNQEIIVAALDRYFGLTDGEREEGIAAIRR